MSERQRIYVAGPMSQGDLAANIKMATCAGVALIQAGFAPLVPQLSAYMDGPTAKHNICGITHGQWLNADLRWVAVSDAVVRLPGKSIGADMEVAEARRLRIPVYDSVLQLIASPPPFRGILDKATKGFFDSLADVAKAVEKSMTPAAPAAGHPGFLKLLDEVREMHCRKAADYGRGADPLANCRAAGEFGLPPWVGVAVRLNDKLHRIKSFCQNGELKNESIEDSFMDLAAYALIALTLYREEQASKAA